MTVMGCIDALWEKEVPKDLKTERPKCDTDIIRNGDVRVFREDDYFSSVSSYVCVCDASGTSKRK